MFDDFIPTETLTAGVEGEGGLRVVALGFCNYVHFVNGFILHLVYCLFETEGILRI